MAYHRLRILFDNYEKTQNMIPVDQFQFQQFSISSSVLPTPSTTMNLIVKICLAICAIAVLGDFLQFGHQAFNPGSDSAALGTLSGGSLLPGASAAPRPWLGVARAIARAASKSKPKGGHSKNKRESNRNKHEKGDSRRQRDQQRAQERRDKQKKG
ncbi:unnamed protein product [Cyprideis torosa]|uniref:Uncharacterized protein n=1 Tax=Cyprideis torosa TaxID=163714 RepID=A0A7R8ZK08_9CRUS|nr:unnamed protein product [Cyprideis torosa]CAG0889722.1 unnamed protein product [Cyprideis torosa]